MPVDTRSFSSGQVRLELDGVDVGLLSAVTGGEPFGRVERTEGGGKHLAGVAYAPIVVEVGIGGETPLLEWVRATLAGKVAPKGGAIVVHDFDGKVRWRREWQSALITEVVFPGVDGASKDVATLTVTIAPERTTFVTGSGAASPTPAPRGKAKSALRANFRLGIDGFESAMARVSAVGPIRIRPGVDVDDVTIWVAESEAPAFAAWFDQLAAAGDDGSQERRATLSFLDPTLKGELLRLDLGPIGVVRVAHPHRTPTSETVPRIQVDLYCEAVRLA
jgi:hypothetical protein